MGKIKQGILGGFSGKVGTVIGASWKGISYMRSIPQKIKNPRTDGQMSQRTKFAIALNFLKPMTGFLRTGYKLYTHKQTAINAAMSHVIANAIDGAYPDYLLDFTKVLVSRGALTPPANGRVVPEIGFIAFTWDDNSGTGSAKPTDKALAVVYNPSRGEAIYDTAGSERMAGSHQIPVPADWTGDAVEIYLGFISEDGKEVSNSVHLGTLNIA